MKILVVDDDAIALELLGTCLLEAGFSDLTLVDSSERAEGLIQDPSRQFDCILLDISMPKKNGIELCQDIRSINRYLNTPVLMVTRLNNRESISEAFSKGATDYITKPFEFSEVVARIRFAHRTVIERQAAIDSYLQADSRRANQLRSTATGVLRRVNAAISRDNFQIENGSIIPISVLENYVIKMFDTKNCRVDVIGIRFENINQLHDELSTKNFNACIENFICAVKTSIDGSHAFLSYLGEGVFVCAANEIECGNPDDVEANMRYYMVKKGAGTQNIGKQSIFLSVGDPVRLHPSTKPNFSRLLKVVVARLDAREVSQRELRVAVA